LTFHFVCLHVVEQRSQFGIEIVDRVLCQSGSSSDVPHTVGLRQTGKQLQCLF